MTALGGGPGGRSAPWKRAPRPWSGFAVPPPETLPETPYGGLASGILLRARKLSTHMKELLPDIERWREAGKKVAVATVVQAYGSAPRRAGAKMAISEDGEFVGSVSGGCVENDVVEHARQVIEDDAARLVPYGISDDMAFNVGLACGGRIEVFIQPFGRAFPTEKPVAFAYVIDGNQANVG